MCRDDNQLMADGKGSATVAERTIPVADPVLQTKQSRQQNKQVQRDSSDTGTVHVYDMSTSYSSLSMSVTLRILIICGYCFMRFV